MWTYSKERIDDALKDDSWTSNRGPGQGHFLLEVSNVLYFKMGNHLLVGKTWKEEIIASNRQDAERKKGTNYMPNLLVETLSVVNIPSF